jgi:hypothetical protein
VKDANVLTVAVEHFHRQHEVLPLVRVRDEQSLGRTVALRDKRIRSIKVKLVADE